MSFAKNAFVFLSGAVVGAGALTAFVGYQAFKMLKKNDVLYSAVEESVKAGVHTGGNEFGNRLAKIVTDKLFGNPKPSIHVRSQFSYQSPNEMTPAYDIPIYENRVAAENTLNAMKDIVKQYGFVSIADLYDESGLVGKDYTFNKYGWTNLDDAMIIHTTAGYTLSLPRVRPE